MRYYEIKSDRSISSHLKSGACARSHIASLIMDGFADVLVEEELCKTTTMFCALVWRSVHFVTGLLLGHLPSSCSSKKRFHRGLRAHSQNEHNRGRFVAFCRGQYSAYDAVIALLLMRLFPGPGYRHQLRPNVDLPETTGLGLFAFIPICCTRLGYMSPERLGPAGLDLTMALNCYGVGSSAVKVDMH